jgi:hypothetical protein
LVSSSSSSDNGGKFYLANLILFENQSRMKTRFTDFYLLWWLGRKPETLRIYKEGGTMFSEFARNLGLPGLGKMDRTHIRHCLTSLHE